MTKVPPETVSIVGSLRQRYKEVLDDWIVFAEAGLVVGPPKATPVIEPGIDFVRFTSDGFSLTDALVQQSALHRILGSDFVYTVAPEGCVGRTASYEIGRILQANVPLYPNHKPLSL